MYDHAHGQNMWGWVALPLSFAICYPLWLVFLDAATSGISKSLVFSFQFHRSPIVVDSNVVKPTINDPHDHQKMHGIKDGERHV